MSIKTDDRWLSDPDRIKGSPQKSMLMATTGMLEIVWSFLQKEVQGSDVRQFRGLHPKVSTVCVLVEKVSKKVAAFKDEEQLR